MEFQILGVNWQVRVFCTVLIEVNPQGMVIRDWLSLTNTPPGPKVEGQRDFYREMGLYPNQYGNTPLSVSRGLKMCFPGGSMDSVLCYSLSCWDEMQPNLGCHCPLREIIPNPYSSNTKSGYSQRIND